MCGKSSCIFILWVASSLTVLWLMSPFITIICNVVMINVFMTSHFMTNTVAPQYQHPCLSLRVWVLVYFFDRLRRAESAGPPSRRSSEGSKSGSSSAEALWWVPGFIITATGNRGGVPASQLVVLGLNLGVA